MGLAMFLVQQQQQRQK